MRDSGFRIVTLRRAYHGGSETRFAVAVEANSCVGSGFWGSGVRVMEDGDDGAGVGEESEKKGVGAVVL